MEPPGIDPVRRTLGERDSVEAGIPPEIPGREQYWRTPRRRVHRLGCGYVRHGVLREWVEQRGRSWAEIDQEAEGRGEVIWWCIKCYPQAHPAARAGERRWRKRKKIR